MAFQGIFRRHNKFVVVKPIRLSANDTLEVGTVIDMEKDNVKWFQLRLWFKRRRIGTVDSDWANQLIGGARRPEGAPIHKIDTTRDIKNLTDTLVKVAGTKEASTAPEGKKPDETAPEVDKLAEGTSKEPEVDVAALQANAEREQIEADEAKAKLVRAQKDAKNARERERRAAKKAAK